jgi:hypothetical protein
LKSSFQSSIFLDVFPVFIKGGSPHTLEFSPGQRWLKDIGSIYGSFGSTGSNYGMQFINKYYYIPSRLYLINDFSQTIFKFTPVFSTGNHRG